MRAGARLALFAAIGALVFGGGFAAGRALDPDPGASGGPAHPVPRHEEPDRNERDR